jgi:hypothetical protein
VAVARMCWVRSTIRSVIVAPRRPHFAS